MKDRRSSPTSLTHGNKICIFAEDRLTSLPKAALDAILIRIPLLDAARASTVSRAWRDAWMSITELNFILSDFPSSERPSQTEYERKIMNIVDRVLLLHRRPIRRFVFDLPFRSCEHISRWVLFLSRIGTEEFIVTPTKGERFHVPSDLFSCEGITYLSLANCKIVPPTLFSGFKDLRTLCLSEVSCSENGLHALLSSCPLLNHLTLTSIYNCDRLYLSAQNLASLNVYGSFQDICFVETPLLADVCITLFIENGFHNQENKATCELVKMLGCLPNISRMTLHGDTIKMMSAGNIPPRLPTTTRLLYFRSYIDFNDTQQILLALCIFRSSPYLQKVHLIASFSNTESLSVENLWKAEDCFEGFSDLKTLNVDITGTAAELRFIQLVLDSAPLLRMVQIKLQVEDVRNNILRKVSRFRRLSSRAQVSITE